MVHMTIKIERQNKRKPYKSNPSASSSRWNFEHPEKIPPISKESLPKPKQTLVEVNKTKPMDNHERTRDICERTSRDQRQGSNHSVLGGQDEVFRRVKGVLDGSKSEVLETCAVAWCKGRLRGEALVKELQQTIEVDCNGKLVPIRVNEVEVVHAHDIVCQCETEDASSENTDQVEERREVSQDALAESDAARYYRGK
ncbi:hypothetical protein V6N13_113975 [Hibiscus sabdariffa]